MLYIFDKDGTLVDAPDRENNRPANTPEEQVLLPHVKEIIYHLRRTGNKIAIASNQGGVAWGFLTLAQADALLRDCAEKIGGAHTYRFCPHDDRKNEPCACRKPKGGMLKEIMAELGETPANTVMVGDQLTDAAAAQNAGCSFAIAYDFFRWWGI